MPYATNEDLPVTIRTRLPTHAQDIFRATFNSAWDSYGRRDLADREATAHRVAWAAVKHQYHKEGDRWVANA